MAYMQRQQQQHHHQQQQHEDIPPPYSAVSAYSIPMTDPTQQPGVFYPSNRYSKTSLSPPSPLPAGAPPSYHEPNVQTSQMGFPTPPKAKSLVDAYVLCLVFGPLGAHQFYLGRGSIGLMYLLTFGLFGVGWVVDLLRMPWLVDQVNKGYVRQLQAHSQQTAVWSQPCTTLDAYILWFPCGLLGFHHFYLRNPGMGTLYLMTFGLLGIGWLVDLFRIPSLVREANDLQQFGGRPYSQCMAHMLVFSPAGVLGGHHFYLNRPVWGVLYFFTLGLLGIGWVFDWVRTSCLVKRARTVRTGQVSWDWKYLDDAYLLWFTFGLVGMHHFYLRRYGWGILYFFTLGMLGIGCLVDFFRLPCLVRECNTRTDDTQRIIVTHTPDPTSPVPGHPGYPAAACGYQGGAASYPDYGAAHLGQTPVGSVINVPPQYLANPEGSIHETRQNGAVSPPPYESSLDSTRLSTK